MIRLFMSTDIAGSTQYKSAGSRSDAVWLEIFRQFFSHFPIMLMGHIAREFMLEESLPELAIWKFLGDEAIFMANPASPEEATLLVRAHFSAMATYEEEYLTDLPLQLKGTAWLAEFPAPNIEIEVPELSGEDAQHFDFIGPDIDLGFRISKLARPSTVAISLDLLDTVLRSGNRDQLDFYLAGREELKGVLFGRPYPVIWARAAGAPFGFAPWDIDDNPAIAAVVNGQPAATEELQRVVDTTRAYLRKMHGVNVDPPKFG